MNIFLRKFCACAVLLASALAFPSIAAANSCTYRVQAPDIVEQNYCLQPAIQFVCEASGQQVPEVTTQYSSGDCSSAGVVGICRVFNGEEVITETFYYDGDEQTQMIFCLSQNGEWTGSGGGGGGGGGGAIYFPPLDIAGMRDISSDTVPDIALLNLSKLSALGPYVSLLSGTDASRIDRIKFFSDNYVPYRMDTGLDANQNGSISDPFIAVLAVHNNTLKSWVQVRSAKTGAKLRPNLRFFSENYAPIDVAILDDTNGDGVPDDPSVAVLAQKITSGRQAVMLRSLVTGKRLANWTITANEQTVLAIAGATVKGTAPNNARILVLTLDSSGGEKPKYRVLPIRVSNGALLSKQTVIGSSWRLRDIAIQRDGNRNGVANDPAYVVLGIQGSTGNSKVRVRDVKSNTKLVGDITILSDTWEALWVGVAPDMSGNNVEDVVVVATRPSGLGVDVRIKVRDLKTGDSVDNLDP